MTPSGIVDINISINDNVDYSYGVSPSTNRIDLTCFSGPDGIVGHYHYGGGVGGYVN